MALSKAAQAVHHFGRKTSLQPIPMEVHIKYHLKKLDSPLEKKTLQI